MDDQLKEMKMLKDKHDQMYGSVSLLNSRIEELEGQKLILLQKLKDLGDRSNIEYILRMQKIDYNQFRVPEKTVQVEEYLPELNRDAKDIEYYEQKKL